MNPQAAASYRAGHSAPHLNFPRYLLLGDRYPQTLALLPGCDPAGQRSGRGSLCSEQPTGVTWAVAFGGRPQAWPGAPVLAIGWDASVLLRALPSNRTTRVAGSKTGNLGVASPSCLGPKPCRVSPLPLPVVQSPGEGTGPASGWSEGFTDMDERGRVGGAWWQ